MHICDAVTVKGLQRSHFSSSYHVPGYGEKILYSLIIFFSYHSQGGFEYTSTMFVRYSVIAALCVTQFQGDYIVYYLSKQKVE